MSGSNTWTPVGSPTSGTSVTVPGLAAGTEYDLEVTAANSFGSATSTLVTATTTTGGAGSVAPAAPTALVTKNPTTSSIGISWTASASGTAPIAYQVQFRLTGMTAWSNFGSSISGTSATVTGLNAGSSYDFQVVATNANGTTASSPLTASTAAAGIPPSAPVSLKVTAVSPTSATLSWAASTTGTPPISYLLFFRPTPSGSTTVPWSAFGLAIAGTTQTVTGLTSGRSYDFRVTATNAYATTTSATATAITTTVAPPSAPGALTISAITPNSASLTWSVASGPGPITYQPQYQVAGQTVWANSGSPISTLSAIVSGLSAGQTYNFQVLALGPGGSTASATQTAATTVAPSTPGAPGTPVAWIITPTSVSLTWSASDTGSAPITYRIQYRVHGTSAWTSFGIPAAALSGTVTGLTAGTSYDFRIAASNSAGTSASNFLSILAPITGGSVSQAAYQPNQILTAEALDASLNSKLDVAGGSVGPLQQAQSAAGGSQTPMLAMTRSAGGPSDSPMMTGSYVAIFADGPVVPYGSVAMTMTIAGDAAGNGPAGNVWNVLGAININALRSSSAPANGSQHAALTGQVTKNVPAAGIPAGRRLADGWAVYAPVTDNTGLPSSQSGAVAGVFAPITANGRDDVDLRVGARITYGETTSVAAGGYPAEFSRGLYVGAGGTTAYAKVIIEASGNFSTAALDLRGTKLGAGTITSASPSTPVTAVSVDKGLLFASAGSPAASVTASNPKAVTINGNSYSVVAVSLNAASSSGVLTFASPVSAADAAQGNAVLPAAHTVWLNDGADIALNQAATSSILYDASGGGATIVAGTDRVTLRSTSAVRLPSGSSAQRPASPGLGDLRANIDTASLEWFQPSSGAWVAVGSSSTSGGAAPSPATTVITGSPAPTAVPLSWLTPSSGAQPFAYQVQYRVSGTASWTNWGSPQASTSTTISGLTAGTRYDFQIVTSNSYGNSTSAITSVTMASVPPAGPANPSAASMTSTTALLTWTASASGTTPISYQPKYRVTGQTAWISSAAGPTTATSQTITGLTPATGYDFEVVATNAGGSASSAVATATTTTASSVAPGAPTSVAASTPTPNSLTVSWGAPATGTAPFSYQVSYRLTGTTAFAQFGGSITATSLVVTGLTASDSYDFEVTATNSAGSATSGIVSAVTAAQPPSSSGAVTGLQTSGTSAPVISGPTTGSTPPSNILPITGVTVTDPGAATAVGSCTLSVTCSVGTISATVGGAQVTGSGSRSISYVNTLSACQTAAADLIYTAAGSSGSDNVVITFTDQAGSNSSISVAVTIATISTGGGSGGSIPSDATGTVAAYAQALLNGFGVNTRIDDATYQSITLSTVENYVNALGGIKILRDCTKSASDGTWWAQVASATNTQFIVYLPQSNQTDWDTYFTMTGGVPGQYLIAFEGCDEADTGAAVGYAETLQQAATYQQTVWAGAQQYGLPCIQMSFGQGFNTNPNQGNYGAVGDQGAYANYGNGHLFPGTSPMAAGHLPTTITLCGLATPNKPAAITEFGWGQTPSSAYNSCSQTTAAAYILEFIFDAFSLGCPYYVWYSLIDDTSGASIGLFTNTGTARKSAIAVKNLFTLLTDTGANALTFSPGKLNYSLANFPPVSNGVGGYSKLLQRSDGSFWLALWNEQVLNSTADGSDIAVANVSITLTLGTTATSITVYDPSVSTTPVQSASNVSALAISLPARVILVKIVRP